MTARVDTMLKLELYDMVDVKKIYENKSTNDRKNYFEGWLLTYRCAISNEAFKTLAGFSQIAGFAPTSLIIFVFRLLIGQQR